MNDVLKGLYDVILSRRDAPQEGSYTCYLFEKGLDKILKKCGEECSEVIIAAKNGVNTDTEEEICDLLYHLLVLMAQQDIRPERIEEILEARRQKIGNLKQFHQSDHNTSREGRHMPPLSLCSAYPFIRKKLGPRILFQAHGHSPYSTPGESEGRYQPRLL